MRCSSSYDLVIAGAGIVGASTAWHAVRQGLRVAIIDAKGPAAAASGASDGAVSVASKRPGLMADLAAASLTYTGQLAQTSNVLNGVFHPRPTFLFSRSAREEQALDRLNEMLNEQVSPVSVVHDGPVGKASVSGLGQTVKRVIELTGEGHMLGYQATLAYLNASACTAIWPAEVQGFECTAAGVRVQTSIGELSCGKLVIATGMGTKNLLPDLPLIPRSGQLIVSERSAEAAHALPGPLTSAAYLLDKTPGRAGNAGTPVVIDPLNTGQILIGSSREDNGTERQTDIHTVRRLLASAVECLPQIAERRVVRVFAGVRTATEDGLPIVGPIIGKPGVFCATGFEGDGICLSALIGREVAALITTGKTNVDLSGLSPQRFSDQERLSA